MSGVTGDKARKKRTAAHLQFWDQFPPSRREILMTLVKALNLLSTALPIALESVGKEDVETQMAFWADFGQFERETDLTGLRFDPHALSRKLADWAEVAHIRIEKTTGDVDAE